LSQQLPKTPVGGEWTVRSTQGSLELAGRASSAPASSSLTYEPHYGLKEKAFSLSADPRFLYRSPAHAPAFEELLTGIRRREGLIVLTGEIGTGKTTLIRSVLQHLDRRTFTAFVPDPFVSREDLLKMLLVDFGVVSLADLKRGSLAGASRPDLSYPLYEFLDSLVPLQAFAVVIIDEAQNLPLSLLEEIRILSDLEQREKLLQVVLVGQPELKAHLKMPQMRQVDQRVSVRCELSSLGLSDVGKYVHHRLAVASENASRVQFSDAAIETIFKASGGTPRVINLICDRALQRGHRINATTIEAALITEAVTSLGIEMPKREAAPAPVQAAAPVEAKSHVLEIQPRTPDVKPPIPDIRSRALEAKPTTPEVTPRAAEVMKAASMPVTRPPSPPQILSDFAAEAELAGPLDEPGTRRLAFALLIAFLVLAAIIAVWFFYFTAATSELEAAALPPPPKWRSELPAFTARSIETAKNRGEPQSSSPAAVHAANYGSYAIQVASFESRTRADRLVSELAQAGFRARTVEFDLGSPRGLVLQIRLDGYQNAADAERDLAKIRELPGYEDAHLLVN
jgi:general secretion pathway protein A